ncbi:MAG: hypothetical protein JNK05_15075 [Myxococcales bacterium]|nr:hypothetical protein [Myxococcales bacterium]
MTAVNDPLHAYVRFYLTVLSQLDEVHGALARTRKDVLDTIHPYSDVLTAANDEGAWYGARADEIQKSLSTDVLWRPSDPATLSGLTDVYEVIGRFTFQGEDDNNVRALAALVKRAQADVDAQRAWLSALSKVPSGATRLAEGLSQQELAEQERDRKKRLEPFEPVAVALREQCAKVLEAVHGVARPDVASLDSANANYQEYVRRVQGLYTKALPYLRRSLQDLCAVAQVDTPSSWPDVLPFAESLPAELLTPPPDETPAVAALRAQLEQAEAQIQAIVRAVEEGNLAQRKREQDKLAAISREEELKVEVEVAKNIVRWATKSDELDQLAQTLDGHAQQRNARATLVAQLSLQQQQLDGAVQQLRADVAVKEQEANAAQTKLQETKDNPPALFGKEEWRRKVDELDEETRERKEALLQRRRVLAESEGQLTAVATRLAGEKTQVALLDRAVTDAQSRADAARAELIEIEKALGTQRPARRLSVQQADEYLAGVWNARNEVRARIDTLTSQHRSGQLELERVAAQGRQWTAERERLRGALEQARKASNVAQQEALRQLSARRQQGVAQYIERTLAPLEESLSQVDRIFVDPARQVLVQRSSGPAPKAGTMRANAEGLALALAQLAPRVEPVLAEQAGVLDRIQKDFVEKAGDAVKGAWT